MYFEGKYDWIDFAKYIGANFFHLGEYSYGILYKHYDWQIMMDTFRKPDSIWKALISSQDEDDKANTNWMETPILGTQVCMPFIPKKEFEFHIYEGKRLGPLSKLKGKKDRIIGDEKFDANYIVIVNDTTLIKELLNNDKIKELCYKIIGLNLKIKQNYLIEEVDVNGNITHYYFNNLYFETDHIISDFNQLFYIFKLFTCLIDQMVSIGAAEAIAPDITLVDAS